MATIYSVNYAQLLRTLCIVRYCERYVMLEPSRGMCEVARATLSNTGVELHNCSIEELTSEQEFDCVLSHLCLQGIPDLLSFVHVMASKLSDKGTLVASLPHPAFYNDYKKFFPESSFRYKTEISAMVSFNVTLDPHRPIEGVPYHHRPISSYISAFSNVDVCISDFYEVTPSPEIEALYGAPWQTPRYLVLFGRLCRGV
ncbi:MAG: class I SAM-dependent methyltransferase [Gammaproteobacteria bacterium]